MNDSNPFQAPQAYVADIPADSGDFLPEGRRVPAGRGAAWISGGWELFRRSTGTWIGITLAFLFIIIAASVIPLANLLVGLVTPVFAGGLMLGCKALEDGEDLRFSHLFAGFSNQFGNLVLVGVLYLVGMVAVFIVVGLLMGVTGAGAAIASAGRPGLSGIFTAMAVPILLGAVLIVPLAMAVWYAPALVVLHQVAPFQAMKVSFFVAIRNFLPFLVYGLVLLVLAILASIPLLLGWLALAPTIYTSIYASYKDLFTTNGA